MSAELATETYAVPSKPVRVIDVSAVQGVIDWPAVAASGICGAVLKATEGRVGTDPRFALNCRGATDAGLAVGAYHFGKPKTNPGESTAQDAIAEAHRFFELVDGLGSSAGSIRPTLDIEVFDGLAPSVVAEWIRVFLAEAEQLFERIPMIYTGLPMVPALKLVPTATRHHLWLAQYPQTIIGKDAKGRTLYSKAKTFEEIEASGDPPRVEPWSRNAWTLHQFSGGINGADVYMPGNRVPGIVGDVDCNRFNGDADAWIGFLAMP